MIALDKQFDVDFANKIARLESFNKNLYRPNTYLHKWWARRCGSTFRLILKQLAPAGADKDYYGAGGLEGVIICDPMMGGGTILHEAIRLGANVIAADIDPIPVLQARASLSTLSLGDIKETFLELLDYLEAGLDPLFQTSCPSCLVPVPLRYTLYGYRRRCLCGPAIHVDSLILRHEGNQVTRRLCPHCHQVHINEHCPDDHRPTGKTPIYEKGIQICAVCQGGFEDELLRPFYDRYQPLVIVGKCADHGLFLKGIDAADLSRIDKADSLRSMINFDVDLTISPGPKSDALLRHSVTTYDELFSSRQLYMLKLVIDKLKSIEPAKRLTLALLFSTALEFNSMLCGYKGTHKRRAGAIRHTFSHHAYSLPYTALENNPVYRQKTSGTLRKLFHDRVVRAKKWAIRPRERNILERGEKFYFIDGEVDAGTEVAEPRALQQGIRRFYLRQGSSTTLNIADDSVDYVVTDPPYYDSVEYGDLSAFFRVWLRQLVGETNREDIQWEYSIPKDLSDLGSMDKDDRTYNSYRQMMSGIFTECSRIVRKKHGRLVFTFHHWQPDAWAALTTSLHQARFTLINRYVVHSENPISVHINNMRALTDDVILVLAPVKTRKHRRWEKPDRLSYQSSAAFCSDCGSLLGWLLDHEINEETTRQIWRQAAMIDQ